MNQVIRTRLDKAKEVVAYPAQEQKVDWKPIGLWYSVNNDWERFCQAEMPDWLENKYKHAITLGSEKILIIRNNEELDKFHESYKAIGPLYGIENIDWAAISKLFDGIEITPYIHDRRLTYDWYYTWDCASGCIWQPRGVKCSPF